MPRTDRRLRGDHDRREPDLAFRDPLGIRPLVYGTVEGGVAVASESVALELMGGKLIRDVLPGEVVVLEKGQLARTSRIPSSGERAHCMFEWVYFSRPDSIAEDLPIYDVRHRIGVRLAKESPVEADLVVPVPDSARPQALGFSEGSKIPYAEALIKNRFVERTFILPDQKRRESEVRVKLHPVPGSLKGKRIVLLDDSIVRGTTFREIVQMVRGAGATRIDVRIGCPPIRAPCYFGVDMKERQGARRHRARRGRDRAGGGCGQRPLPLDGRARRVDHAPSRESLSRLPHGQYPVDVPEEHHRFQKSLEEF